MSLLCDIGNSYAHFYDGASVWREEYDRIDRYRDEEVFYINVNPHLQERLRQMDRWVDLAPYIELESRYEGLGVDRKALCLAVEEGVVVDAGSAITVDIVKRGVHEGGFIYPGLRAMRKAFASISPVLDRDFDFSWEGLPQHTAQALGFGALMPIVAAIERLDGPIYVTGGDGELLCRYLPQARFVEDLIFRGLQKVKDSIC